MLDRHCAGLMEQTREKKRSAYSAFQKVQIDFWLNVEC
jgi:hypothetical protein